MKTLSISELMNILTIDLEDWFHLLDYDGTASPVQWENYQSRIEDNTYRLLEILESYNVKATFFCLGWIAKKYPLLVKQIAGKHELASHGMNHLLAFNSSPALFEEDLKQSLDVIASASGTAVRIYRAPGFSLTAQSRWLPDMLLRNGITIDCSVYPGKRNHGGYSGLPLTPFRINAASGSIKEFPVSVTSFFSASIAYAGGGYFRALPYFLIRNFLSGHKYNMTYFHPRDFDPGQPLINGLPLKRKLMSYSGLKSAENKFRKMLSDFRFITISDADKLIDWNKTPVMDFTY